MRKAYLLLPLALLASAPAHATLPDPVRAMIDAAIATGDAKKVEAVVEAARTTNPDDVAEIDAILSAYTTQQRELAEAEARAREEAIRQAGLLERWSGEGQLGAFQSSGNTDALGLSAQLQLVREGIDWKHKLRLGADYRRNNGQTQREQFIATYEPNLRLNDRLFAYALAQYERDRFQGFSGRYSASGGLGYKAIDNDRMQLQVKAGPAWRHTEYVSGLSDGSLALLLGADFDWKMVDNISLTQDVNAVSEAGGSALAFIGTDNISLNLVTGLEAGISDALTARISYTVEYDSDPPPGAVSTDTLTRLTLIYGF